MSDDQTNDEQPEVGSQPGSTPDAQAADGGPANPSTSGPSAASTGSAGDAPTSSDAAADAQRGVGIGGFVGTIEHDEPSTAQPGGPSDPAAPGKRGKRGKGGPPRRKNFLRRHLALTTLGTLVILVVALLGGFAWYLNHSFSNIPRITNIHGLTTPGSGGSGESAGAENVLLLGADNGTSSNTVADELADGHWTPGSHRSDTIMVLHIPANRKSAQVVSIPRDSWVPVPGFVGDVNGYAKINAAFSWGGPSLAVQVVKQLTGIPINHVAIMDWDGLVGLTNALGGVRVYIPQTFTDDSQHITWHQGWQTLNGTQALAYVRTRHGLANGDFGRIDRQQNFMRTILSQLASAGTFENPVRLLHVVNSLSGFIEVDSSWSNSALRSLAISLRNVRSSDVQFATAPYSGEPVIAGQDVVTLNLPKTKELFQQLNHGNIEPFLAANPTSRLPGTTDVH